MAPEDLAAELAKRNGCNLGVRLDQYAVLDPDSKAAGELCESWENNGQLPRTVAWKTAAGNIKRLYRRPPGLEKPLTDKATSLQLRTGARFQDVIPPSYVKDPEKGIDGHYEWLPGQDPESIEPALLPEKIIEYFKKPQAKSQQSMHPAGDYEAYASKALGDELAELARTPEGSHNRNNQLNRSAFALGQLVGAGVLDRGSVEAALYGVAASIGLGETDTRATIRSGIEAGMKEPRQLPERERPRSTPKQEAPRPPQTEPAQEKPSIADLICDVSTFISIEFPEKHNIIEPWLNESTINMVYGSRGVGKTMYALGVLCAATTGEPFGAWQVNTPVPSLYLDGEMAPQDTQNRLNRFPSLKNQGRQPLIIYCDAQMNQYGLPRANLLDDDWRKMMKELLLANGVKLWVADNIASLAPGIDENSKQEWDPVNQWFLELRFAGITTIFLHHANKDGGQRGTSGREDNIDISILLDKPRNYAPEDGARFVVKFQKARIEHKYLPLITDTEFALETDEDENYFWTYGTVKKQHKTQVITMLDEGIKATDIAEELGINKSRVSQIKAEAVKDGLLTKEGKLTQSGFAYVSKN